MLKTLRTLTLQVSTLVQKLHKKFVAPSNAQRRESRLCGKVLDIMKKLKSLQLVTSLGIYENIPLNLLRGKHGRHFVDEQKQFAITLHYYSPAAMAGRTRCGRQLWTFVM